MLENQENTLPTDCVHTRASQVANYPRAGEFAVKLDSAAHLLRPLLVSCQQAEAAEAAQRQYQRLLPMIATLKVRRRWNTGTNLTVWCVLSISCVLYS